MLADSDRTVRHKCVEAFSNDDNVKAGNRNAVAGVALQTSHADPLVREAAIQVQDAECRMQKAEGMHLMHVARTASMQKSQAKLPLANACTHTHTHTQNKTTKTPTAACGRERARSDSGDA
eukprot:2527431-Rhodomonas_salina.1